MEGKCRCCRSEPATDQCMPFPPMCNKCFNQCPAKGDRCRQGISDAEFEAYRRKLVAL